jgi:hypothetical protein
MIVLGGRTSNFVWGRGLWRVTLSVLSREGVILNILIHKMLASRSV